MGISSSLGSSALLPAGLGFRNIIINGDMRINQRNRTVTANDYTVDRWVWQNFGYAAISVASNTDVPTGQGFTSSLRITTTTGAAAGGYSFSYLGQIVEGFNSAQLAWGTAGAKPAAISFWVRSSVTGVHSVTVGNGDETYFCPCSYTINAANTWEKKTVSVVGTTTGTWATNNTAGLKLYFFTSIGSSYAVGASGVWSASSLGVLGTVNDNATTGNIFAITGVQLEQNIQPTPFEQRPIGVELALCQRYYEKSYDTTTAPGANTNNGLILLTATTESAGSVYTPIRFKVPKRYTGYSITPYTNSGSSGNWRYTRNGVADTAATANVTYLGTEGFGLYVLTGAGWVAAQIYGHWVCDAEL